MRTILVLLFLCTTPLVDTIAHVISIDGYIRDHKTQELLPFASIAIVNKSTGTIANEEGHFSIKADLEDTLVFSYVGYEIQKICVANLPSPTLVSLNRATISLQEIQVFSQELNAKDIIRKIKENYEDNYLKNSHRQRVFIHDYERVPVPQSNEIEIKSSDFMELNESMLDEIMDNVPEEFVDYKDAIVDLYTHEDTHQLIPVQGVSIEESSMAELGKEMERILGDFIADLKATHQNEDIYYKFRSGVFSTKLDAQPEFDSLIEEQKKDSLHYLIPAGVVKQEILYISKEYGDIKGENWEFIDSPGKYTYELGELTVFNGQLVYDITFSPKSRGLFEGRIYVTTDTYAIIQADFVYAPNKTSENIQLLGFGHSMKSKKCKAIYEKKEDGYQLKYLNIYQNESASINRDFSISKKKKRFLLDKELNEIKLAVSLDMDIHAHWELLVMEREEITEDQFKLVKEPKAIKFKKKISYENELWKTSSVLTPTEELKKYQRSQTN